MKNNKLLPVFCFLMLGVQGRAEFKTNPDPQTLWIEDGKNIKTTNTNFGNGWNATDIAVSPNPDGGFFMEQKKQGKPRTGRMVPVSPEYPYIVYEINELEMKKGYHAIWLPLLGSAMTVMEGNVQKGVFAINYYENSKLKPNAKQSFIGMDIHGMRVGFKYIKAVKFPDYYIKVESPAFAEKKILRSGRQSEIHRLPERRSRRRFTAVFPADGPATGRQRVEQAPAAAGQRQRQQGVERGNHAENHFIEERSGAADQSGDSGQ